MKLVLTVAEGTIERDVHSLEQGVLEIGREDECGVRFAASEVQVSRRHARVEATSGGFRLVDHDSTNGTLVNGMRISSAALHSGDVISLGAKGPRLLVEIKPQSDAEAPPGTQSVSARRTLMAAGYDPTRDKGRRYSFGSILLVLGMIGLGALLGLGVALTTLYELGPALAAVGMAVAFLPAPFYLLIWLWLDRFDPEPVWVLAAALVWGGGAATFVSLVANSLFGAVVVSVTGNEGLTEFLAASISAPFVEEATKGLAVLLIFLALRREFDGVVDGIVYAGVVALGFATVENVLYYGRMAAEGGASGVTALFVLRGILGPFSHSVFTAMTGIGCGVARETKNQGLRLLAPLLGYGAAVTLHGLWNTLAHLSGSPAGYLLVYFLVWAPLFLVFFLVVTVLSFREAALIRRHLEPEVACGLITAEQAAIIGSWPRRIGWLVAALGDLERLSARRRFLHAATRLALSSWHAQRAIAAGRETCSLGQIPGLRHELEELKPIATAR